MSAREGWLTLGERAFGARARQGQLRRREQDVVEGAPRDARRLAMVPRHHRGKPVVAPNDPQTSPMVSLHLG